MSTLAEDLAGGAPIAAPRRPGITTRVHRMEENDEDSPARLKARILEALREKQPLERKALREQLDVDDTDLGSALGSLRVSDLVHIVRGEGYYIGAKALAGDAGVSALQKPEEEPMPRGVYDRSKAKAREGGEAAGDDVKPGKRKKAKRKASAARAAKPRASEGGAQFIVDDLGSVSIVHGEQRIELSAPESTRLHSFLERTKSFRE